MTKLTFVIAALALILSAGMTIDRFTGLAKKMQSVRGPLKFDISNVKLEPKIESYGGATLAIHGVVRENTTGSDGNQVLLLKRKLTFSKSPAIREAQDAILVREGTGLLDVSAYLTSEEMRSLTSADLASGSVTWEPVGVMQLAPASIEIR